MRRLQLYTPRMVPAGMLMITAMALAFAAETAAAFEAAADESRQPLWLLSTRQAPRGGNLEMGDDRIKYWRRTDQHSWEHTDERQLIAQNDPAVPTVVFVHGNRSDLGDAICEGMPVYRHLQRCGEGRPFRFVIWAWPADRICGARKDAQVKACYSDVQSYYLADWLGRIDTAGSVNLIGYSFGARVITGALHLLGGGRIAGRALPDSEGSERGPLRAVLVAAALDPDWLAPGRRNGLALSQVDRLLVTKNPCDPVLKLYRLMNGRGGPMALGHNGPTCTRQLGPEREKLEVFSVAGAVGRSHAWFDYLKSGRLRLQFVRNTFDDTPTHEP